MHTPALQIDIETLDVRPSASIVALGANLFDMYGNDDEQSLRALPGFDRSITAESNEKVGRTIGASTVVWWMQQGKDAQSKIYEKHNQTNLTAALTEFRMWMAKLSPQPKFIFANDPDFDVVILRSAFEDTKQMWPYHFSANRSVRTTKHLAYPDNDMPKITSGTAHVAYDDCIKQSLIVQHCIGVIEGRIQPGVSH